jgi:tetratricopeptide (TPR) repeat protein
MSVSSASARPAPRLERLLGFLDHDPTNVRLIADAAATALEEGAPDTARALIDRCEQLAPASPVLMNLKGLVAIHARAFGEASRLFESLLADSPSDPALRFNAALCGTALGEHERADALLDERTAAASAQAARLKIQTLHHLARLEDAIATGAALSGLYPNDAPLAGALAAVALDAGDLPLAEQYAERAGEQHDGLAALGMLRLGDDKVAESLTLFERSLAADATDARALLGTGLALVATGDLERAPAYLDGAAEGFGRHLGSWVAAGWAYFVKGDYATSRARFETAEAIDDTFAETHGGLAVLDILEGRLESAQRRTAVALRLDRNCFAGALAKVLLLAGQGDIRSAERVRNIALNAPIGPNGRTLAQAMARMGAGGWAGKR